MSRSLVFIRHSDVEVDPATPSREWSLSPVGRSRALQLALQLIGFNLTRIIASDEPKARETGQIVADELRLPWQMAPGLHEHDRVGAPFFTNRLDFEAAVDRLFDQPDTLVFGNETANQARERFDSAVHRAVTAYPTDTLAIVTHGTVLTLFLAHYNQLEPARFRRELQLPDFVVVRLPRMELWSGV